MNREKKVTPVIYECPSEEEISQSKSQTNIGQSGKKIRLSLTGKDVQANQEISTTQQAGELDELNNVIDTLNKKGSPSKINIIKKSNDFPVIGETSASEEDNEVTPITYEEAYNFFKSSEFYDIKSRELKENREKSKTCMTSCCSCLVGKINSNLEREKNIMICLQKSKYTNPNSNLDNDEIENRILVQLYTFYTKHKKCPRIGEHWTQIGFQSENPKNDLITVGVFGPFQFLYFTEKYSDFAYDLFKFLISQKCDWVFAKTMFDISKIVMNLIDIGVLDFHFNKRNKVAYVINEIFTGMVFYFNQMIREDSENESLTLQYIANVIQNIRTKSYTEIDDFMHNHVRLEQEE